MEELYNFIVSGLDARESYRAEHGTRKQLTYRCSAKYSFKKLLLFLKSYRFIAHVLASRGWDDKDFLFLVETFISGQGVAKEWEGGQDCWPRFVVGPPSDESTDDLMPQQLSTCPSNAIRSECDPPAAHKCDLKAHRRCKPRSCPSSRERSNAAAADKIRRRKGRIVKVPNWNGHSV